MYKVRIYNAQKVKQSVCANISVLWGWLITAQMQGVLCQAKECFISLDLKANSSIFHPGHYFPIISDLSD